MSVRKRKNNNNGICVLALSLVILVGCADCENYISKSVLPREGEVQIDTIYLKWGDRAYTVANKKTGDKLLYYDDKFSVSAKVGDSVVKRKGEAEYTLYTDDSVYVQRFDCAKERGIIIYSTKRNLSTQQQH